MSRFSGAFTMPPPPDPTKKLEPSFSGTLIESDEDIQRALNGDSEPLLQPVTPSAQWEQSIAPQSQPVYATPQIPGIVPIPASPKPSIRQETKPSAARPYRPTSRPPVAELTVFDDGKTEGELIRIRTDRFVIGRTEGDLLIPHDELISTRHMEITRQKLVNAYRWIITDLQSTNGLFIRVSRTALVAGTEFIVGSGRYRFDAFEGDPVATLDHVPAIPKPTKSTRGWDEKSPLTTLPTITELIRGGIGNRIVLTRSEYWIGTDLKCDLSRAGDPFCEAKHARISPAPKGGWQVEHFKSLNGLWYRVAQTTIESTVLFMIGEQRFRLRV